MSAFNGRRLPVYLVLDVSGSMTGEPIEAVRQGVKALLSDLRADPQALETAYLAVITFGSEAIQHSPLTELTAFQEPVLSACGTTAFGAALTVLRKSIEDEVKRSSETVKGDWRPLIFLMTDGCPTDLWQGPAAKLREAKVGNLVACAAGPNADVAVLQQITESVVQLNTLQPDQLKAFFKWVSASIKATSQAISGGVGPLNLPAPPAGLTIVP